MPPSPALPLEFAVTPRFDLFYALYTLTSGGQTPLAAWREKALRRLPRDFERVARRVAPVPLFWPLLADALQGTAGEMSFEEILTTLRTMPVDELKANVLSGIFHDRATVQSLLSRKRSLRKVLTDENVAGGELLAHFGLRPYEASSQASSAMVTLLSEPEAFRDELSLVLQRFWQTGFKHDWSALEPALRADAHRMKRLSEKRSLAEFSRELNLPAALDESTGELRPRSGPAIKLHRVDLCYIIPSAFNTRRWWAKYETKSRRVSLYFPVASAAASPNAIAEDDWSGQDAPTGIPGRHAQAINAEAVFRALGDTTRYAIASILARTPTTSAELARSLKVSKPTITHHVQALRAAGLIAEATEGGSSRLTLDRETVAALSTAAVQQLFSSTGDLQLLTTRKRRS